MADIDFKSSVPQEKSPDFYRLNDRKSSSTITTALIYGGSGTGKSFFGGTAGDRTLFVNIGEGIKTLYSPRFKQKVGANPICVDITEKVNSFGLAETAEAFDAVSDAIDHALTHLSDDFDTIVVDDASALRRFALNKGLEINQKMGRSQSKVNSRNNEIIVRAVQDYGVEMNLIEQFIASYTTIAKSEKKHFIMTAHERLLYEKQLDAKGNPIIGAAPILKRVMPGFTGQTFPDQIPMYFDWVFNMECKAGGPEGVVFRARTVGDDTVTAKCRDGGVFKSYEVNPNFLAMVQRASNLH